MDLVNLERTHAALLNRGRGTEVWVNLSGLDRDFLQTALKSNVLASLVDLSGPLHGGDSIAVNRGADNLWGIASVRNRLDVC